MKLLEYSLGITGITGSMLLSFFVDSQHVVGWVVGVLTAIWLIFKILDSKTFKRIFKKCEK